MKQKEIKRQDFEISIFGEKWQVKFQHPCFLEDMSQVAGYCDQRNKSLVIDGNNDDKYVAETLFHELFHAYMRRMGVINAGIPHEVEEIIADQFAMLLTENFDFKL